MPQLLLSGDFAQLLPMKSDERGLAFEAPSWEQAKVSLLELKEIHRASSDPKLSAMLMALRDGIVSERTVEILKAQHGTFDPDQEGVVRLVSKRDEAKVINEQKLRELPGAEMVFWSIDVGEKKLLADCPSPDALILKEGARVAFTQNGHDETGKFFANGMIGVVQMGSVASRATVGSGIFSRVIASSQSLGYVDIFVPEVKVTYRVSLPSSWTISDVNERRERVVLAQRRQFPLQLGWALTLHKAQGCTFDRVSCDLSSAWEFGHVYVALSRVRRLVDLNIESMPNQSIDMDPRIKPWLHEAI